MSDRASIVIVGAGVIGSALAMHLARLGATNVRVIDVDLEGGLSSSELNAGGVRGTLEQPVNIELSRRSIEYFESIAAEVGFRACGYLWLRSPDLMDRAEQHAEKQRSSGWDVRSFGLADIRSKVPFLDKLEGVAGAHFGVRDGLINPNLLKLHFRSEAQSLGVRFDDRTALRSCEIIPGGLRLRCTQWSRTEKSDEQRRRSELSVSGTAVPESDAHSVIYDADHVINCAGPWASRVAQILGYSSPSVPVRRMVTIFDCRDVDLSPYGMIVDTSGVYFHPEASNGLAGVATPEAAGFNFEYPGETFFEEHVWPALYERSSGFERLRHLTGWAGLYEVSPDHSAIIGAVSDRIFESHSFSGHGVMQSYAAGLALAERIIFGQYRTVDLELLAGNRFEKSRLVKEGAVI